MSRLGQITRAACQVKVQRECEFDDSGIDTESARPPRSVLRVLCVHETVRGPNRVHASTL